MARKLTAITLVTASDDATAKDQLAALGDLQASLQRLGTVLTFSFDSTLHDRDVSFDNGWVVRLGRGLDYFKRTEGLYVVGSHDFSRRQCYACNIDVWQEI